MIRANQRLGKYKIIRRLGEGGFASVYRALDTVEGQHVALKILQPQYLSANLLDEFRHEVRIAARLKHPHILPLKNADMIGNHFVMVFPLGKESLADRLSRRISTTTAMVYLGQLLEAVSHAHEQRVIHCDIKPDNLIIVEDGDLLLSDFGIAKVAVRTVYGSGSGTVGFVAPEQAMGKPTFRSDVFSIGLIGYRMLSGIWLEWPFDWPPTGIHRVRSRVHPDLVDLLRRSLAVDQKKRFRDATQMLAAFERVRNKSLKNASVHGRTAVARSASSKAKNWRSQRVREFKRAFAKSLGPFVDCPKCAGPISEPMTCCPWCGDEQRKFRAETPFPQCCPRCERGMKLDWKYCPWCYGAGFEVESSRRYSDRRFVAKCKNSKCLEESLMRFMRYCPRCSRKTRKNWEVPESKCKCRGCGWGLADDFWSYCPWCGVTAE